MGLVSECAEPIRNKAFQNRADPWRHDCEPRGRNNRGKSLGDPWPNNPMVLLVTGEKTAQLEDDPSASMVYMAGPEAVTFLEVIHAGYVHELTIFRPYLSDKGGYSCIYTRYGAGSHDALAERYVGVAHPL